MLRLSLTLLCLSISSLAWTQPRVAVLPFEAVMDSTYRLIEGKESVLDYQTALQSMIFSELSKLPDIRTVEVGEIDQFMKSLKDRPARFNDLAFAAEACASTGADFAVIGSYGEYSREIRVDARIYVQGMTEIAPGNATSATAKLWEDLPSAAERLAKALAGIIREAGPMRAVSVGRLYPEGSLEAYGAGADANMHKARLVVWVNAPSPKVTATPAADFRRCQPLDRANVPLEKQRENSCHFAVVDPQPVVVRVESRGFLPYEQELSLSSGKAYRLEVRLVEARYQGR